MIEATLHEQRLATVVGLLLDAGARNVLELGCGAGRVLAALLAQPQFETVTGIDSSAETLAVARDALAPWIASGRLCLLHGDIAQLHPQLGQVDAIGLVEVIEHLDPSRLAAMEQNVFMRHRPDCVVVTTPNVECNELLGLRPGQRRDPDHRFEWPRARFRAWAAGVGNRHGYRARFGGIGELHPQLGCPTQYVLLRRRPE